MKPEIGQIWNIKFLEKLMSIEYNCVISEVPFGSFIKVCVISTNDAIERPIGSTITPGSIEEFEIGQAKIGNIIVFFTFLKNKKDTCDKCLLKG